MLEMLFVEPTFRFVTTLRKVRSISIAVTMICLTDCSTEPPLDPDRYDPAPELECGEVRVVAPAAGQASIETNLMPADCLRIPNDKDGAEYLVVGYSAEESAAAGSVDLAIRTRTALPAVTATVMSIGDSGFAFHDALRTLESKAAEFERPSQVRDALAPTLGDLGRFTVCRDIGCEGQDTISATAQYVGGHIALFVDNDTSAEYLADLSLGSLGRLVDEHIYGLDTAAFGSESDVDGNGMIYIVMTPAVNRLCPQVGGIVSGYFFGRDLTNAAGSNRAEVFFAFTPDPNGVNGCRISTDVVRRVLPGTFAHELQHMISYNQHVVVRGGSTERTWLNEGLSHLAEDLVGRQLQDALCVANDCLSQFAFNDVSNAYRYLENPERWALSFANSTTGRLPERGAAWLFLRWTLDHFDGADHKLTKKLVQTDRVGSANVGAATGEDWATLVGKWHLANYLDDLPGFSTTDPTLAFTSWNWRATFPSLRAQYPSLYSRDYPLLPTSVGDGYAFQGGVGAGSGHYMRVILSKGDRPLDLRFEGSNGGQALPGLINVGVARIR